MTELFTAIYAKFTADSDLSDALMGRLYNTYGKQNPTWPYGVFFLVSDVAEATFDTEWENCLVQFNLFSKTRSEEEILDLYTKLTAVYDMCTLNVSGYTHVCMNRLGLASTLLYVEDAWQYSVTYRVRFYKAR